MGFLVNEAFAHQFYNVIKDICIIYYAFIIVICIRGRHGVCASNEGLFELITH
jgi:hypothetical protein